MQVPALNQETSAMLSRFFHHALELMAIAGLDGYIKYANPAWARILGYLPAELLEIPYMSLVHPEDLPRAVQNLERLQQGEPVVYVEARLKDRGGAYKWIGIRARPDESGRIYVVGHDVSERKALEEAQRESEKRFVELFENSPDAILVVSLEGKIMEVNETACALHRIPRIKMLGQSLFNVVPKDAHAEAGVKFGQLAAGQIPYLELEVLNKDGDRFPVELRSRAITYLDQPALLVHARDITKEQQAQRRLRLLAGYLQGVREEERTRIAREVHDVLGQAMTALRMDTVALQKTAVDPDAAERFGQMQTLIDETIQTIRRIATDLRPGVLDDLGLVAALEWQTAQFQKRTDIICRFTTPMEDIELSDTQATALFRIFQELLTNVARHAEATEVTVALETAPTALTMIVEDNGRGITAEDMEKPKSLGLLGMHERLIPWGGTITFAGKPNEGTRVTVALPLSAG